MWISGHGVTFRSASLVDLNIVEDCPSDSLLFLYSEWFPPEETSLKGIFSELEARWVTEFWVLTVPQSVLCEVRVHLGAWRVRKRTLEPVPLEAPQQKNFQLNLEPK